MTDHIETISDADFEREVLGSGPLYLLAFGAVWCAPCRALTPILEQLGSEQRGLLRVGKIDIDDSPLVAARLGIRAAPTVVLFCDGRELARHVGLTSKRKLLALAGLTEAPVQLRA